MIYHPSLLTLRPQLCVLPLGMPAHAFISHYCSQKDLPLESFRFPCSYPDRYLPHVIYKGLDYENTRREVQGRHNWQYIGRFFWHHHCSQGTCIIFNLRELL